MHNVGGSHVWRQQTRLLHASREASQAEESAVKEEKALESSQANGEAAQAKEQDSVQESKPEQVEAAHNVQFKLKRKAQA